MTLAFVPSVAFWTGIAGIVVAGLVGRAVGFWAMASADRRRLRYDEKQKAADRRHERQLKASDDLRDRLDDVAASLEILGQACVDMRDQPVESDDAARAFAAAADAFHLARVRVTRLATRPTRRTRPWRVVRLTRV